MILPDVNVLVYAFSRNAPDHQRYRDWLEETLESSQAFGIADIVLSGFLRVVTHPRVFSPQSPLELAMRFCNALRDQPNAVLVEPGPRHWEIFVDLCRKAAASGNLISDAYLAALAIESGSEWITADRDFSRFTGLKWRHPFQSA